MNEKQLAKLIKKTTAAAGRPPKNRPGHAYDHTLPKREEDASDEERKHFFKEMKRREF
jgi:hypothetical protein